MLRIRLTRRGRRNDPSFRLVVTERANPAKGKFLEDLGHYNPKLKTKSLKKERILYWLSRGAKSSATVHNLLVTEGIIEGPKVKAWRPKPRKSGTQETAKVSETAVNEIKEEKAPAPEEESKKESSGESVKNKDIKADAS